VNDLAVLSRPFCSGATAVTILFFKKYSITSEFANDIFMKRVRRLAQVLYFLRGLGLGRLGRSDLSTRLSYAAISRPFLKQVAFPTVASRAVADRTPTVRNFE
jgi:hypothetical protein